MSQRVAEPVSLSDRDRAILRVLLDDVEAFGAGDETDRADERFQSDARALLRRLSIGGDR